MFIFVFLGVGLKIKTKGHRYISKLKDTIELPCTATGHGFDPFFHSITWFKLDGKKEYQINTIASINKPFVDTTRYSIVPNKTDQTTVHMSLIITSKSTLCE